MAEEATSRMQERMSRPHEGWADIMMSALIGDPVFYGVLGSITVCVLAFVGLLAAKVLIDQIEAEEQREKRREQRERDGEGAEEEDEETEDKKQQ